MTAQTSQRPGGLTAICILAIVLGAFGALFGVGGLMAVAFQGPMQEAMSKLQPQENEEVARAQRQIAEEAQEFAQRHVVRNALFAVARLLVASCLLAGGILSLRLHPYGRKVLLAAFAAGIVFEIAQIWPNLEAIPVTQRAVQLSLQAQQKQMAKGAKAGDMEAMGRVMGKAMAAMQIVMIAGMVLAKAGFYAFGLWYLTRPHTAALFVRPTNPDPQWA